MPTIKIPARVRAACVRFERGMQFRWTVYKFLPAVSIVAAAVTQLCSVASESSPWLVDSFTHFLVPATFVSFLSGLLLKRVRRASWGAAVAGLGLIAWAGSQATPAALDKSNEATQLTVASANVLYSNRNTNSLEHWVKAESVEVLGVLEVSDHWKTALEGLQSRLPYQHIIPQRDAFGIALLSKWPLSDVQVLGEPGVFPATITATVTKSGRHFRVAVTHPVPPGGYASYAAQQQQFTMLGEWAKAQKQPTLVMGDLNATPWSSGYLQLQRQGLKSTNPLAGTWPAHWGSAGTSGWSAFLPIDHIMTGPGLAVKVAHAGPRIGSDHLPVLARLAVE